MTATICIRYPAGMTPPSDTIIRCGLGCNTIIAQHADPDEAEHLAETSGAMYFGGDEGPGEWECKACYAKRLAEGVAEAGVYRRWLAGESMRQLMRERLAKEDAMLERADMIYDEARDRGEI